MITDLWIPGMEICTLYLIGRVPAKKLMKPGQKPELPAVQFLLVLTNIGRMARKFPVKKLINI